MTARQVGRRFADAINQVIKDRKWEWLREMHGGYRSEFADADKYKIKRIRARVALETGTPTNPSIHAHILLEIEHTTMVQIDYRAITKAFKEETGFRGANIHVDFLKGDDDKAFTLKYIMKEVNQWSDRPLHNRLRRAFTGRDSNVVVRKATSYNYE